MIYYGSRAVSMKIRVFSFQVFT